ncbi:MAG TPA: hypothetical protein VIH99_05410 [Bdellovibrionota bacterium]
MKSLWLILPFLGLVACSHGSGNTSGASEQPEKKLTIVESPCNAMKDAKAPQSYEEFDHDKNGTVSRDEYLCKVVKRFNEMDKDHDHFLSNEEMKAAGNWKKKADKSKDKKVSIIEFMNAADEHFKGADKDKNGSLSKTEHHKHMP